MILPKKHLTLEESMFGLGSFLLQHLSVPTSLDNLWYRYVEALNEQSFSVRFSFDDFLLALDYLFLIGAIVQTEEGELKYATD